MSGFTVRRMSPEDIFGAVALQRACFPPPFPAEMLWSESHLFQHLVVFASGQFVAAPDGKIIGSASSCLISEDRWLAHDSWEETVGGPYILNHNPRGSTLYGLDISVHPNWRGKGVGRALYRARFELVRQLGRARYGTACRLPGYLDWSKEQEYPTVADYCQAVVKGEIDDRTLTPLLRYGLTFVDVIHEYMEDPESANSAALLEWLP